MGYYMRFVLNDTKDVDLDQIDAALKKADSAYGLSEWDREREYAELCHGQELYGEIEISRSGSELMDEEIEELIEAIDEVGGPAAEKLTDALRKSKAMVVVRVLWQEREAELTLEKIDPLWNWLFDNFSGFLQADGEGYYDQSGIILKVE